MRTLSRLTFSFIAILMFSNASYAKELNVPFHGQHTLVWCWAATIAMVGEYMTGQKAEDCDVLSAYDRALGGQGLCCSNPQHCNRTGQVAEMKNILGNLYGISGYHYVRPLTYSELRNEIDNNRPMIAALQTNFSGHVIVIIGYSSPDKVIVLDPMSGRHEVSYQQIKANFQTGYWSQTLTVNNTSGAGGATTNTGLPNGSIATQCGCWGYVNIGQVGPSQVCASGREMAIPCPAYCPGGGNAWGTLCQ